MANLLSGVFTILTSIAPKINTISITNNNIFCHSHCTDNAQKCTLVCDLQCSSNSEIWSFYLQYYRRYVSHQKSLNNWRLLKISQNLTYMGPLYVDVCILETTEDIILKFCTFSSTSLMHSLITDWNILPKNLLNWCVMTHNGMKLDLSKLCFECRWECGRWQQDQLWGQKSRYFLHQKCHRVMTQYSPETLC